MATADIAPDRAAANEAPVSYPWRRFAEELRNARDWLLAMTRPGNADRPDIYAEGNHRQRSPYEAVAAARVELLKHYGPLF